MTLIVPTLAWLGDHRDRTPDFDLGLGEPGDVIAGDVLRSQYTRDGLIWTEYTAPIVTVSELVDLSISENASNLLNGNYQFRLRIERGSDIGSWSNNEPVTILTPVGGFRHDPDVFKKQPRPFSRQYFNELKAAERAQQEVEARAERLKSRQAKQALSRAAQEAAEAIAQAKEIEADLTRMTAALEAAKSASNLAETIRQANLATEYARQIQEQEDEAIALLMLH